MKKEYTLKVEVDVTGGEILAMHDLETWCRIQNQHAKPIINGTELSNFRVVEETNS